MTGNIAIDTAISLAGIAFLLALCRALLGRRDAAVTRESASARLEFDEPNFVVSAWLIDARNRAAAALGRGEACFVFAMGDKLASRRATSFDVSFSGEEVRVILKADTVRPLVLTAETGEEAAEWARRLRGLSAIENP
ncbi:MAG: hypothetical protein AAFY22_02935 [Pseudomonadota bacterium]